MKSLIIATVMALCSGSSFGGDTTVRDIPGSEPRPYLMHQPAGPHVQPHHLGGFHPANPYAFRPVHRSAFHGRLAGNHRSVTISLPSFDQADAEMAYAVVEISLPSFDQADRDMQLTEAVKISVPSFDQADAEMAYAGVEISLPKFAEADAEITALMNGSGK